MIANKSQQHGAGKVLLREIEGADSSELCALLAEGFPRRKFEYWQTALDTLTRRAALEDYPRYGYCLEVDGRLEGVLLLLTARIDGVIRSLRSLNGAKRGSPIHSARANARPKMSAAGRARIAAAQRARWAKLRAAKKH